jgi:hypothetical protein
MFVGSSRMSALDSLFSHGFTRMKHGNEDD